MNWFGWDPDGEVTHFLTMWDTLGWEYTTATDSVFVVSTDDTTGGQDQSYGYHTFAVKAVDDRGAEDPTPASVSFTAENIFPDTELIETPGNITWPFVTFEWEGSDPDGEVAGFGYRLLIRDGLEYVECASEDSLTSDETVAEFGPLGGDYRFEVWSIDDQGARDPTPAEWSFQVCYWGPTRFYVSTRVARAADTDLRRRAHHVRLERRGAGHQVQTRLRRHQQLVRVVVDRDALRGNARAGRA
jgi:hypothetical protein